MFIFLPCPAGRTEATGSSSGGLGGGLGTSARAPVHQTVPEEDEDEQDELRALIQMTRMVSPPIQQKETRKQ